MDQKLAVPVLYEDEAVIVCVKPPGMPSQSDRAGSYDMVNWLKNYLVGQGVAAREAGSREPGRQGAGNGRQRAGNGGEPYVGVVHRLDRPVGGVMVYAKNKRAAAGLSAQVQAHEVEKHYLCVVAGDGEDEQGAGDEQDWKVQADELAVDSRTNLSRIVPQGTKGAKRAELRYRLLGRAEGDGQDGNLRLLEVELLTGRHHQIRVQMAAAYGGIWGDTKYNPAFAGKKGWYDLALFSWKLSFRHPVSGEALRFTALPDTGVFGGFRELLEKLEG